MTKSRTNGTYIHPGAIYAVREIRRYRAVHAEASVEEAADVRRSVNAETEGYDYATAIALMKGSDELMVSAASDLPGICREVLQHCICNENHPWKTFIPLGRRILRKGMKETNVLQIFEYGELFVSDDATFEWWAEMERNVRAQGQDVKNAVGREGERLSYDREVEALIAYEDLNPEWESREDSTLGYDIKSYDVTCGPKQIFIEAKACKTRPLSFFISPNEWKNASARPDAYFFHLWDLSRGAGQEKLTVITPEALAPHVPFNRGSGEWRSAQVFWPPKPT